ncbi:MAG TPA: hypothetical protein DCG47_13605 [Spirochaetaceae bacterium]|jgi:hypothetical protein|nr:hypothetical protein [Spirochaetaceae bacterium]
MPQERFTKDDIQARFQELLEDYSTAARYGEFSVRVGFVNGQPVALEVSTRLTQQAGGSV